MDIEDMFSERLSGCGLYQLIFHLGVTSLGLAFTIDALEYSFIGATPKFWCSIPELDHLNFTHEQLALFVSPPENDDVMQRDACRKYSRNYRNVTSKAVNDYIFGNVSGDAMHVKTEKCSQWAFDTSQYIDTVVTEVGVYYYAIPTVFL